MPLNPQYVLQFPKDLTTSQRVSFLTDVAPYYRDAKKIKEFERYRFDPVGYIRRYLSWEPWPSYDNESVGQVELYQAYVRVLQELHEKFYFERGWLKESQLHFWQPGQQIQNWLFVDSGHSIGKTKWLAGLVSHFFDCFPSIIYCFAPIWPQINDLLFKEIRVDRLGNPEVLGTTLPSSPRIKHTGDHFVTGRATQRKGGKRGQTESVHGQHNVYLMFVVDEAEGVDVQIWDAIRAMASGGMSIIVSARNPRTASCEAHRLAGRPNAQRFVISCLKHPNVIEGKPLMPGAVERSYVEDMLEYCEPVEAHDPDRYTFELPWRLGVIYLPRREFLWRVLGIAAEGAVIDTFCPLGRFKAASERIEVADYRPEFISYGCDASRYGDDMGTIYVSHRNVAWRLNQYEKADSYAYFIDLKADIARAVQYEGVTHVSIRIDAGGGFGSGLTDFINHDFELQKRQGDFRPLKELVVHEVNFGGSPYDGEQFADLATEMYYHAGDLMKTMRVVNPTVALEQDVCERKYTYLRGQAQDIKVLIGKDKWRSDYGRSPDDGDGFVLAVAPEHLFAPDFDFEAMG